MAKEKDPCNSNNVPDQTVVEQVTQIETMQQECESKGGSLEVRVLYGCSNDQRLGDSARIKWPPAPYDNLDRPLTEEEKVYLADRLRELMEQAEQEAIRKCPKGTDTGFRVQGFCKAADGTPIRRPDAPSEYNPPFTPAKN